MTVISNWAEATPFELEQHRLVSKFGIPPALAKACIDSFFYRLRLRDGREIEFESAELDEAAPDWVHLSQGEWNRQGVEFARGVDVRLADITWVADCPMGS